MYFIFSYRIVGVSSIGRGRRESERQTNCRNMAKLVNSSAEGSRAVVAAQCPRAQEGAVHSAHHSQTLGLQSLTDANK